MRYWFDFYYGMQYIYLFILSCFFVLAIIYVKLFKTKKMASLFVIAIYWREK